MATEPDIPVTGPNLPNRTTPCFSHPPRKAGICVQSTLDGGRYRKLVFRRLPGGSRRLLGGASRKPKGRRLTRGVQYQRGTISGAVFTINSNFTIKTVKTMKV